MISSAVDLVGRHEGYRRYAYADSRGVLTVGYGRNLQHTGLSRSEALMLLHNDLRDALVVARRYPWFEGLSEPRQAVVLDMLVNLGAGGFRRFTKTRRALADADYATAAREMLDSQWARQVKTRARRLARMMRSGRWP